MAAKKVRNGQDFPSPRNYSDVQKEFPDMVQLRNRVFSNTPPFRGYTPFCPPGIEPLHLFNALMVK